MKVINGIFENASIFFRFIDITILEFNSVRSTPVEDGCPIMQSVDGS